MELLTALGVFAEPLVLDDVEHEFGKDLLDIIDDLLSVSIGYKANI